MSTPPAPPSPVESPAATQARLRRERREAKIKAGGSARLDKITQLSGRPAEAAPAAALASAFAPPAHDDPEEVDISQHAYAASRAGAGRSGEGNDAEMRRMFGGGGGGAVQPGGGLGGGPGGEDDPMLRMLRQMVGGMPPGGEGGEGLPEGLAAMLGGGGGGGVEQGGKEEGGEGARWWRVGHAGLALALGVYVTSVTGFSGSRVGRVGFGDEDGVGLGVKFFWVFVTAELVLQSTRFFVERGRLRGGSGGVVGMVMGVLPEPWKGYLGLVRRYGGIWTTVVEDAMVVVFVLGVKAWWKGGAVR